MTDPSRQESLQNQILPQPKHLHEVGNEFLYKS